MLRHQGSTIATLALVAALACMPARSDARGGGMHGIGGAGLAGGGLHAGGMGTGMRSAMGGRPGEHPPMATPAYMLISAAGVSDAGGFKTLVDGLPPTLTPFAGRLAADADKPAAWQGEAPSRLIIIRFDSLEQAQAWTNAEAFKSFLADLHRTATASVTLLPGLPLAEGRFAAAPGGAGWGGRGRGFDQKAFEPYVERNDALLSRMKAICSGC